MSGNRPAELVVGSAQLGLPYGAANRTGKPESAAALRMIRRAAAAGVSKFDTARAYGDAEERLGQGLARGAVAITKLSPLDDLAANAGRDAVREKVDASIAASLSSLRKTRLDCLLLHRADHIHAFDGAVWERLQEHLACGNVAALGVSVQSPAEAAMALQLPEIRHIQLPFNVLDWRWREAGTIGALRGRREIIVHVRSVFLQGLLAANDPRIWPRIPGVNAVALIGWLNETARQWNRTGPADLCLAYALGQDWIDGVVVGMETEAQLETNLTLAARAPFDRAACAAIENSSPRVPDRLLDPAKW